MGLHRLTAVLGVTRAYSWAGGYMGLQPGANMTYISISMNGNFR